ncbi:PAS domain-containing protein [Methylocystis parvus]|uniref:histidine kinase n=1 Tax=Methylocystis parvus TaxID=134 RepID=A0A6B8M8B7_9HYPH|nr:PAS domain-containing protein [Methylocystis parvus]QGM99011.1 PAS domain-containing protein [Methylocystis parvus]WBK00625.1 PAS domain-containing protein [Methylocystis parvus OBBP]
MTSRPAEGDDSLSFLMRSFAQIYWETEADGAVVADSPSWRKYTGQTVEERLGDGWLKAIYPEDRADAEKEWRAAIAGVRRYDATYRLKHCGGGWRWTDVHAVPYLDSARSVRKWVGMHIDVDARKRAEIALREREARLLLAQDFAKVGMWFWDRTTNQTTFNPTYFELYGLPQNAPHQYEDFLALVHPEDRDKVDARMKAALAGKAPFMAEYRVRRANDRAELWITAKGKAEFDAAGRPICVSGVAYDVTERMRVETILREREALLRDQAAALESAIDDAPLNQTLGALSRMVVRALGDETRAAFYLSEDDNLTLRHIVGMPDAYARAVAGFKIGPESLACGLATYSGEPVLTADVSTDERWAPWRWLAERFDYRGCWSFPINTEAGRFVGTLAIYFRAPHEVNERDVDLARIITRTASIIISHHMQTEARARAEAALRQSESQQAFLLTLSDGLRHLSDAAGIRENAARLLRAHLGCDRVVYVETVEDEETVLCTAEDVAPGLARLLGGRFRFGDFDESNLDKLRGGETVAHADLKTDASLRTQQQDAFEALQIRSYACTPLVKGDRFVAALIALNATPHVWTTSELDALKETAERTWAAVERARAETALRNSEEKFRILANTAPALIWHNGQNGENIYINQYFLDYTGRSEDEVRGEGWRSLLDPDHAQNYVADYLAAVRDRRGWRRRDRIRRHDGQLRWFENYAQPLLGENGEYFGHVGVSTEIDDLVQAQAALAGAARRKDEFIAMLAHELRNPLAPIRSGLEVLSRTERADQREEKMIGIMQRQTDQVVRLVDDLLEISRISRGKIKLRKETIDVTAALRLALEASFPLIEKGGQKCAITEPSEPLLVFADRARLVQIFTNLLSNAVKFTPHGGAIDLIAKRDNDEAVITVEDDGRGISTEQLPHIFDLFAQIDSHGDGGLGIGLALVRNLVLLHGGSVSACSDGLGMGSKFTIRLPLDMAHSPVADTGRPADANPSKRVLVIDDNRDAADVLCILLQGLGATVRAAYDGRNGAAIVQEFLPDVVLLDLGMPGLDGYETASIIRNLPEGRDVRLVALTGWGQEDARLKTKSAGFNAHITKPASVEALRDLLSERDER